MGRKPAYISRKYGQSGVQQMHHPVSRGRTTRACHESRNDCGDRPVCGSWLRGGWVTSCYQHSNDIFSLQLSMPHATCRMPPPFLRNSAAVSQRRTRGRRSSASLGRLQFLAPMVNFRNARGSTTEQPLHRGEVHCGNGSSVMCLMGFGRVFV